MSDVPNNCGMCRFWLNFKSASDSEYGECHKHSPSAGDYRWPISYAYEWCGEFDGNKEWERLKAEEHDKDTNPSRWA
jgi:hypothetical protein